MQSDLFRSDKLMASIIRAGRYRTNSGWSLGPARTTTWKDLTLWLLIDGHGTLRTPEGTVAIAPGSCLLLRGGQAYEVVPHQGIRLTHWFAHFDLIDDAGRVLDYTRLDLPPVMRQLPAPGRVVDLWERLDACLPDDPARANQWLAVLRHEIALQEQAAAAGAIRDPITLGLVDLAKRMREAPADEHRVAVWTKRLGLGRDQLRRRFIAEHGCPPRTYLTLQRMRLAEHLLTTSSSSVAEIATWTGYASQHFFSRHFRVHAGCSPSDFRQRRGASSVDQSSRSAPRAATSRGLRPKRAVNKRLK